MLNHQQKQAVETTEGRVLVLAGAGTGKTFVITERIKYLLKKGVAGTDILGLTFTNKAAREMAERLGRNEGVTLCTFHSYCMKVLRKEIHHLGYTKSFTLYDPYDVERLAKNLAREILGAEKDLPSLSASLKLIHQAKNQGSANFDPFSKDLGQRLETSMRAHNAVDFDDLICLTVQLFEKYPEVLEKYQTPYIMIDEYQDTNPIQYKLSNLLAAKYNNLCVVGDDDQSIYGWRGADVKNILEFDSGITVKLEQNYRSTPTILNAANAVIANNTSRHGKALWSEGADGEPLHIFHTSTDEEEALAVAKKIIEVRNSFQLRWSDIAILYRSNALSRQFEQTFLKTLWKDGDQWRRGIPYKIYGGLSFYERREVKDLVAYLRVIVNPKDEVALLRIINTPRRGIGSTTLDRITQKSRQEGRPLWEYLDENPSTAAFKELILLAKEKFTGKLDEAMEWLIKIINYEKAIQEEVKSDKMRAFKWENVEELVTSLSEAKGTLEEFIADTNLDQNRQQEDKSGDSVQMMTIHSAKGLEFPACFLVGLEDNIIPHEKSLSEGGLDEERRLMYVAITRAKRILFLSMAKVRRRMGREVRSTPSRFLYEIPKEYLKPIII